MESNGSDGTAAAPACNGGRRHELVPKLRLYPGYHFVPTDEELVDFYLRGKIERRKPPMDFINEVDIMSFDPVKLIEKYKGYGENRWYFFTVRKPSKTKKQDEPNRKVVVDGVEEGSWSATGSVAYICGKDQETIIGTKRVLTYKSVRSAEEDKWSMHEYIMVDKSQLKQTYEAEKKAQEKGKRGVKRKRTATRKGRKGDIDQTTSQEQEDQQQETSPPGDPHDQSVDASYFSMQMMLGGEEEVALIPWCDDCMAQPDQTEYPAVWYNQQEQQPLRFVDPSMMTQGYIGDLSYIQNQFDQQQADDHGSIAFDEALDQRHDTNFKWDNAGIYPGNNLLDGNLDDYTQDQFGNQANLGALIGELEHGTGYQFHDTLQATPSSDDASAQSMGIQPAAGNSMGDDDETWCNDDLSSLLDDISRSLLDGNGVMKMQEIHREAIRACSSAKIGTNGRS